MTSLTCACVAAGPARSSSRATRTLINGVGAQHAAPLPRATSPPRVLRVRRRPRHALKLLLRDGPEVMLVRDVRRRVRVPRPDPGEEEVLAGPMQIVPAGQLARHLALPLVHDEVQGHLAGSDEDRRIALMAHRAQLRRVRRRRVTRGAYPTPANAPKLCAVS